MRTTFRGFAALSPLALATAVTALIQSKALAVLIGPEGMGFYGLALSFITLFSTIATFGLSTALMKSIAEIGGTERNQDISRNVILGVATVVAVGVALIAVVIPNRDLIVDLVLNDTDTSAGDKEFIVVAAALGALPVAMVPTLGGVLRGLRSIREFVRAGLIAAVAPMSGVIIGAAQGGGRGAFAGFIAGQLIAVGVLLFFTVRVARAKGVRLMWGIDRRRAWSLERSLLALGLLALAIGLAASLGQSVIRASIADDLDLRAVGFFAAAWSLSNRLPSLIYKTFTSYLMPEISSLRTDWRAIGELQNDACRISLLIATPVFCLVAAAAPWVVSLLLSDEFLPMVTLLQLMLVGEVLSVVAWAAASAFYPSGRGRIAVFVEWTFWLIFVGGTLVAMGLDELNAVGAAYVGAQISLLALAYVWERRHHGFRFRWENVRLIVISLVAVGGSVAVSALAGLPTAANAGVAIALLIGWALTVVSRAEWDALARGLGRPSPPS